MKNIFLILFLVLLFASCSQKGKTKSNMIVSIGSIAASNLEAFRDGGAMLYGKNSTTGDQFGINLIDVDGPIELDLTNGDWTFTGLLWDGGAGNLKFEGISYCASLQSSLSGGDVELPLNFTNGTCELLADFMVGTTGAKNFPPLEILGCRNLSNINTDVDSCNVTAGDEGIALSYAIQVKTFKSFGSFPVGNPVSRCFDVVTSKDTAPGMMLPHARLGLPFQVEIRSYYNTGCDNLRGFHKKVFNNGLNIDSTLNHKIFAASGSGTTKLYHKVSGQDVCNTSIADPVAAFSSGNGNPESPHGICFPEQWDIIGQAPATFTQNYELLRDIDFSGRMTDVDGAVNPPHPDTCVGYGGNFRPVGQVIATTGTDPCDTPTDGLGDSFSGEFNGNNHKIIKPYLFHEVSDRAGLFRHTSGATIKNLVVEGAEIEGEERTGIIVGDALDTNFYNIKIDKSMVFGGLYTGALAGVSRGSSPASIDGVYATRVTVEAEGNYIGGLIGHFDYTVSTLMEKLYFAGIVEARDSSGPTAEGVGGIIGKVSGSSSTIGGVVSRGVVLGKMKKAGGIIGMDSSAGIDILEFRSEMAIAVHHYINGGSGNEMYIGGIVGLTGPAASNINNGYFTGTIFHNCTSPGGECLIGEFSGNNGAATVGTKVYANGSKQVAVNFGGYQSFISKNNDAEMRALAGTDFLSGGTGWSFNTGHYPKLEWEELNVPNFCDLPINRENPSVQISAGKGTANNPIGICNANQFASISPGATEHYILYDNLNMIDEMDQSLNGQVSNFSGVLDGNGFLIQGLQGEKDSTEFGIIKLNNGDIHDLNFVGIDLVRDSSTGTDLNGFVYENNGEIKNIKVFGIKMSSTGGTPLESVGGLVSINNGLIKGATFDSVLMNFSEGGNKIGGIVGLNNGVIRQVTAGTNIELSGSANFTNIGGLIGSSVGSQVIEELEWWGYFDVRSDASGTIENCGGLAGALNGTNLTNSLTSDYTMINMGRCQRAGGLVGQLQNNSVISKSYNGAEVSFGYCDEVGYMTRKSCEVDGGFTWISNGALVGPIAGELLTGGSVEASSFFAANAHTKEDIQGIGTAVVSSDTCVVTLSTSSPVAINGNSRAFIIEHNNYFSVLSQTGNDYTIDMDTTSALYDATDCTDLGGESITFTNKETSNIEGTYQRAPELKDILTFCPSASGASGDSYYTCQASEWDIVEDSDGGIGLDRVLDYYVGTITGNEVLSPPVWSLEPGERFPRLLFNN